MKLTDIIESKVKQAWMDGTYNSKGTTTPSQHTFTFLARVDGQYYHATRSGKTIDDAANRFLYNLRRKTRRFELTKKDCGTTVVSATSIPRTSVDLDRI